MKGSFRQKEKWKRQVNIGAYKIAFDSNINRNRRLEAREEDNFQQIILCSRDQARLRRIGTFEKNLKLAERKNIEKPQVKFCYTQQAWQKYYIANRH